jgi:formylglycine-generating enzyme required for sulfatase activity
MVVLPGPVEYTMGSPGRESRVSINRTFAIGAKAVTVGEVRRLHPNHQREEDKGHPEPDWPAAFVSWFDAAEYCNWLNEQEGLPKSEWCYEPNKDGQFAEGMRLAPNYLSRSGYRLPTEAEMEYAIRAGATTSRFYGESEELLVKYGWVVTNSPGGVRPVGRLKPNDFGLFDMHGNVWCWCLDADNNFPRGKAGQVLEDKERKLDIDPKQFRVLRGGCQNDFANIVGSGCRYKAAPDTTRTNLIGFRVARTFARD